MVSLAERRTYRLRTRYFDYTIHGDYMVHLYSPMRFMVLLSLGSEKSTMRFGPLSRTWVSDVESDAELPAEWVTELPADPEASDDTAEHLLHGLLAWSLWFCGQQT